MGSEENQLGSYDLILLDLNGTIMFGHDRFGPDENYFETYRTLGGALLNEIELSTGIDSLVAHMTKRYDDPIRYESFPSVHSVLRQLNSTNRWPDSELEIVEQVVALHELGTIPEAFAQTVIELSKSHSLGVVNNLWSMKEPWISELDRAGIVDLFEIQIFSSDGRNIKPSPFIFQPILETLFYPSNSVLMIGDSMQRDVAGASAAGLQSMWINDGGEVPTVKGVVPEYTIRSLIDLGQTSRFD